MNIELGWGRTPGLSEMTPVDARLSPPPLACRVSAPQKNTVSGKQRHAWLPYLYYHKEEASNDGKHHIPVA